MYLAKQHIKGMAKEYRYGLALLAATFLLGLLLDRLIDGGPDGPTALGKVYNPQMQPWVCEPAKKPPAR